MNMQLTHAIFNNKFNNNYLWRGSLKKKENNK